MAAINANCVPYTGGPELGTQEAWIRIKTVVETKTWEQEGGQPDTSQPPDTHTSVEDVDTDAGDPLDACNLCHLNDPHECPPDSVPVVVEEAVLPNASSVEVAWAHWYSVDPEIPHLKTYHAKETKTTTWWAHAKKRFTCFDLARLKELLQTLEHLQGLP